MHHMSHFSKASGLQRGACIERTLPGAADQQHRSRLVASLAFNRGHKLLRVGGHLGVLVPGNVDDPRRPADVQRFNFHAHIHKHNVVAAVEPLPGLLGLQMLHG